MLELPTGNSEHVDNQTTRKSLPAIGFVESLTTYNHGKRNFNDVLRSD